MINLLKPSNWTGDCADLQGTWRLWRRWRITNHRPNQNPKPKDNQPKIIKPKRRKSQRKSEQRRSRFQSIKMINRFNLI